MVPISENELEYEMKVAKEWRENGKTATVVAGDKRLGDKLTYAAKVAKSAIVLGDNEVKTGVYEVKKFN